MIDTVLDYQTTDLNFLKRLMISPSPGLDSFHDDLICLPMLQERRLEIALITKFRLSKNSLFDFFQSCLSVTIIHETCLYMSLYVISINYHLFPPRFWDCTYIFYSSFSSLVILTCDDKDRALLQSNSYYFGSLGTKYDFMCILAQFALQ